MALYAKESGKQFSKPNTGKYVGTVIDIVDLGLCTPKNPNPQFPAVPVHRVQVVWQIVGADGKSEEYSEAPPNKLGTGGGKFKPTRLYAIASGILQSPVPQPFATFDVESLIGKSNELFIVKTGDGDNARSEVAGFLPVPPGVVPPTAPAGFVRKVNRPVPNAVGNTALPAAQAAVPAQSKEVSF
jgi:hypothetical protein